MIVQDASETPDWQVAVLECRRRLTVLEAIKDDILVLLGGASGIGDSTRAMWVGDTRSAYICAANAVARLASVASLNDEHAVAARDALLEARSRAAQVASELRGLDGESAAGLHARWLTAFEACDQAITGALRRVLVVDVPLPVVEPVTMLAEGHVVLHCSVCGRIAAEIHAGIEPVTQREGLVYSGIAHAAVYPLELAPPILAELRAGRIADAHLQIIAAGVCHEGVDAYCPDCDLVYCGEHYAATEEFDGGFYDCTYGTCPEGHRRIIDD